MGHASYPVINFFRSHGFEASHAFFNECVTAKFHFNEAVFPIFEVYHRITLSAHLYPDNDILLR